MKVMLLCTGLAAATALAAHQLHTLNQRVNELESLPRVTPDETTQLAQRLDQLRRSLQDARAEFEADDRAELVGARLERVSEALARESSRLADQDQRLRHWETRWGNAEPERLEGRLDELSTNLGQRTRDLEELRALSARTSAEGDAELSELKARVEPLLAKGEPDRLWHELVGPVVQLSGDLTVGSGVLLESQQRASGEGWVTHLLTSWHVVRDIYGTIERVETPVPVRMYEPSGRYHDETAHMVAYDVGLDIALLEMDLDVAVPHGAKLATREELESVRTFEAVYAVGCPLGNDPIPTSGEIASTAHAVDGLNYWMISAPTYIGNSGGGIFRAADHRLVGIFSKIYTHGSARTTIVPHMGLATPLPVIYDWLDRSGQTARLGLESNVRTASAPK
jgi:S1-C subfamily serine protease